MIDFFLASIFMIFPGIKCDHNIYYIQKNKVS